MTESCIFNKNGNFSFFSATLLPDITNISIAGQKGGVELEKEQRWIRAVLRRGSKKAADALVRKYYDEIYAFVYKQVGNREDAFDLTQESFIAVLRSLPTYDVKKAGFRTWLYHIVTHKVIDYRRKGKLILIPLEEQEIVLEEDFTENIQNKELLEEIEKFVCSAQPEVQEVFRLRIYAGYSFPEIATAMAQPESKVKAQYYRLLEKVRKEFGE